jgi:hypothetical protein
LAELDFGRGVFRRLKREGRTQRSGEIRTGQQLADFERHPSFQHLSTLPIAVRLQYWAEQFAERSNGHQSERDEVDLEGLRHSVVVLQRGEFPDDNELVIA